MGTISDKLTYLNTTKSQLKDMINYGLPSEQQITSSTTFRNYVSSIFNAFLEALRTPDTLFTNLPKKSGTGANITLNDTANAPMRITLGASELTQDGTPTPSSPQDIHTISGSNKVVVNGKNLIPYQDKDFTINGVNFKTINGNLILNGTATFNITGDMLVNDNYLKVDVEHTTYYLTRTNVNSNLTVNLMGENSTLVAQFPRNSSDLSTTVSISSSNKVYLGFFIPQGATFNNYDGGIMVSKAGGTYEPYISQEQEVDLGNIEYCKIGNYEDKFIRSNDGTWQLEKNIGKVVLDGTENWQYSSGNTAFYIQLDNALNPPNNNTIFAYSNYFKGDTANHAVSSSYDYILGTNTLGYTWFRYNSLTTTESFKTWLGSNNTSVYYILATPTYTQITGTLAEQLENVYQKLLSYSGTTNISQVNNDLAFVMSVSAVEEL